MSTNKQNMRYNAINRITELSDSDFMSFLYSERERENSLSQYQGWTNWALAGAIIGAFISGYTIAKENWYDLDFLRVTYYVSGFWAFFLGCKFLGVIFERLRSVDLSKVRKLKSVTPWVDIIFILISSLVFETILILSEERGFIVWLWGIVFIWYIVVLFLSLFFREYIVSAFYDNIILPHSKIAPIAVSILGGMFGLIAAQSFNIASWYICNSNFELAVCLASIIILIYILLVTNLKNTAVKQFDKIVDEYLYRGVSKEKTFEDIRINRMGCNALEICRKELNDIASLIQSYGGEVKTMSTIIQTFEEGIYSFEDIRKYHNDTIKIIRGLDTLLKRNNILFKRIEQMKKQAPLIINTQEYDQLCELSEKTMILAKARISEIHVVIGELQKIVRQYYCHKYGGLCFRVCDKRYEKSSLTCLIYIWKQYIWNNIKAI